MVVATIPLWTSLIAGPTASGTRITPVAGGALILGLVGTALMVYERFSSASPLLAAVGLMVGVLAWSYGSVQLSRTPVGMSTLWAAGVQMVAGGLALGTVLLMTIGVRRDTPPMSSEIATALILVTLVGSVLCPACYAHAVKRLPVTVVSLHAYVNPVVAMAIAVYHRKTPFTWSVLFGAAIILVAVTVAGRSENRRGEFEQYSPAATR